MKLLLTCLLLMVGVVTLVAADEEQEMKGMSIICNRTFLNINILTSRNILIINSH